MTEKQYDPEELVFSAQVVERLGVTPVMVSKALKDRKLKETIVPDNFYSGGRGHPKRWMRWKDVLKWWNGLSEAKRKRTEQRASTREQLLFPETPGCDSCEFGRTHPRSDTGWQCSIAKNHTCKPWFSANHHEPAKVD